MTDHSPGSGASLPRNRDLSSASAAAVSQPPTTLSDALQRAEVSGLPKRTIAGFRAAVNLVAKVTRRNSDDLPAQPAALRPVVAGLRGCTTDISPRRWRVAVRRIGSLAALTGAAGVETAPVHLSEAWQRMLDAIPHDRSRRARRACLGGFARYCALNGVEPVDVEPHHLDGYRQWRHDTSLAENIAQLVNSARRAFNVAVEHRPESGPRRLVAPRDPRVRARPLGAFPPAFAEALAAYLHALRHPDPFGARAKALSVATVDSRRQLILMAASLLVEGGTPVESLSGLAPLAAPAAMQAVLLDLHARAGRRWTSYAKVTASTLVDLARWCGDLREEDMQRILKLQTMVKVGRIGMGPRSRDRLMQFNDEDLLARLYELPDRLYALAEARVRAGARVRAAEIHERALALHLTLVQPLRVANLCRLDLERHFRRDGRGRITGLVIPAGETKGGVEVSTALPRNMSAALDRHLVQHRPQLLRGAASTSLFPGAGSAPTRAPAVLARGISGTVKRHLGAEYNTHLARHLAATLLIDANPANGPVAQRVLGHSSLKVTESVYGFLRTRRAQEIYGEVVEQKLARRRKIAGRGARAGGAGR